MDLAKVTSTVRLLRPIFLLGGLEMNLFGAALAYHLDSRIDWTSFICFQLVLVALQFSGHAANDYADLKSDAANNNRTWFSGGSGVLPSGGLSRRAAVRLSAAFAVITILASVAFTIALGWDPIILILILIGLGLSLQYSLGPLRLSSRGIGEIMMMLIFGSICADAAFMLQHGGWDNMALFATAPLMVQVMILMLLTEYPDFESDSSAGKRNLVVRIGRDKARAAAMTLMPVGAVVSLSGILGGMSDLNSISVALTFAAEVAVIAVILRLLRSSRIGYNWLTSASIGFLVLIGLVSALTM